MCGMLTAITRASRATAQKISENFPSVPGLPEASVKLAQRMNEFTVKRVFMQSPLRQISGPGAGRPLVVGIGLWPLVISIFSKLLFIWQHVPVSQRTLFSINLRYNAVVWWTDHALEPDHLRAR
jgi:hypothetical protein